MKVHFDQEKCLQNDGFSVIRHLFSFFFFPKGRESSVMISYYLIMHSSDPFFTLDAMEYKQTLEVFPELAFNNDVNYIEKSARGFIDVGYDSYIDNCTILAQFERLFKSIQF